MPKEDEGFTGCLSSNAYPKNFIINQLKYKRPAGLLFTISFAKSLIKLESFQQERRILII